MEAGFRPKARYLRYIAIGVPPSSVGEENYNLLTADRSERDFLDVESLIFFALPVMYSVLDVLTRTDVMLRRRIKEAVVFLLFTVEWAQIAAYFFCMIFFF
jgi:hypothetical protein